jgi:hypothetical protein
MIQITNQMRVLVAIEPVDVRLGIGWVAGVATLLCDLVGRSGRRSESCTGPDATFKNIDHDGHLHAIRSPSLRRAVAQMMDMVDERLRNSMLPRVQSSTELER